MNILKLNENFVLRKLFDVYLLVPIRRNSITKDAITMNKTAAMIFEEASKTNDVVELAELVLSHFCVEDIELEKTKSILYEYIKTLITENLLVKG